MSTQEVSSYRNLQGYRRLVELLPLTTPLRVHIDPANVCNFRCKFCPTGAPDLLKTVNRPAGIMSLSLFEKIVDDLTEFSSKVKRLELYKDGEPFINRNLASMIRYAKKKNIADSVEVTSNGSLIDHERALEVIEAGLDNLRVSVEHVTPEGYKDITGTFWDYDKIRNNVEFLFNEKVRRGSNLIIHAKIIDTGLSQYEKQKFKSDFSPISDRISINNLMGWSFSEAKDFTLGVATNVAEDGVSPLKKDRKVCPDPFYIMSINFNGSVSVCCDDWSHGTVIGNAERETGRHLEWGTAARVPNASPDRTESENKTMRKLSFSGRKAPYE